jgi:hypothetical protein
LALVALASAAAAVVLVFALTSGSAASPPYRSNQAQIKAKLAVRLHERLLKPHWIVCVRTGRLFHDAAVVRCNVNFGDPHIQAYCAVLRGDKLVTQYDDAKLPCQHDDAGYRIQTLN